MKKINIHFIFLYNFLLNLNIIITRNLCPNNPLINIGYITTQQNISLITTNGNKYDSIITNEERVNYEKMIELKQSFTASLNSVSASFTPEKQSYWDGLNHIIFVFFMLSLFPIAFIIIYLLLRFLFKKCSGPKEESDITRFYRNSTWVLIILSAITIFILFTIILSNSIKINNAVEKTFDRASELIETKDNVYQNIMETISSYKEFNMTVPEETLMNSFKSHIEHYIEIIKEHTNEIKSNDNNRNIAIILFYIYYLIILILPFVFFFFIFKKTEGILFILLLFTIPAMLIFEGYVVKFFFFYSDLCGTINGALYSKEFPVAGHSLGYYYNCYDRQTKAELYGIRFVLFRSAIESINEHHQEALEKYHLLNNNVLIPQLNCEIVNEIVPTIESDFCKDNLIRLYDIIILMNWLLLITFLFTVCVRRLENLIWKKKMEIESMIENLEQLY